MSTFSLISPDRASTTIAPPTMNETMSAIPSDLADLRRRLDEIDDRLHDLLIERAEIVSRVAASKKQTAMWPFYQPAREAADHSPARRPAPRRAAVRERSCGCGARCWRRPSGSKRPFAVAVFAPAEAQGFWDLARDHYGSHTPMSAYRSIGQVIRAVTEGQASVGVLPMPQEGDPDPWWRHLLSEDDNAPRVIARLPFGARGNARSDGADALAIGRGEQLETGADRTFFAAESAADISRARFLGLLSSAGSGLHFLRVLRACRRARQSDRDRRLRADLPIRASPASVRSSATALYRLLPFGGYARPAVRGGAAPRRLAGEALTPRWLSLPTAPGPAPAGHSRHRSLCRRRGKDRRRRAADPSRLERKRAGPERQSDGRLSRTRRARSTATPTAAPKRCARRSAGVTGSIRRASSAAPARTS